MKRIIRVFPRRTNAFNCEIDPFCRRVLKYHFPDAKQCTDIRTTDFTVWAGRVDVLTGGFPCQPFSVAGKRHGTDDPRHLWPAMLRAIREIRPRWVVGENVCGIVSWSGGLVFEQVCADLEAEGYEVQPFVLPACGVGAPHCRDRVWFVAHRSDAGLETVRKGQDGVFSDTVAADTDSLRSPITGGTRDGRCGFKNDDSIPHWERFPTESPVCRGDDGFPAGLDGITVPRWRAESIKAYGNAIVPQVAYRIFETINHML